MRVVLDTNVLVRAASGPPGPADELLRLCLMPPHVVCASPFLLTEVGRVLRYLRVQRLHGMSDQEMDAYVHDLQSASLLVDVPPAAVEAVVPFDAQDDPIVATAVIAHAESLCTRDKHLHREEVVRYCAAHGVEVISDIDLLHRLRGNTA